MNNILTLENYINMMFTENKHHLNELLKIVTSLHPDQNQPGKLEGNCMYDNCTTNINPLFYNKQFNIFKAAERSSKIVEVGVNAGHSLLIMLLSNSVSKIYAFDICIHPYTEHCVNYLNSQFNNRVSLIKGNSKISMPDFTSKNPNFDGDLFHIDGMHEYDTDHDFQNSYKLAKKDAIILWDDSDNHILSELWNRYVNQNKVNDITDQYLPTHIHQHKIGKIQK